MTTSSNRRFTTLTTIGPLCGLCLPLLMGYAGSAWAELGHSQSDFGGVGLMQTPTARMAPVGEFSFTYSRTKPYRRYNISLQPLDWMEFTFRYIEVENRIYAASTDQRNNLDKGVDAKFRLLTEGRYRPELALGLRDAGGTSLFGAEYLVASKRWYDFDFSLGLGWGYLGTRDDFGNPLGAIDDRFDERPGHAGGDQGGEFALDQLFRGPVALFGGIEYQTPWDPLVLQLEYEGNDYQNEPQNNDQEQDSPFNIGARYHVNKNLSFNFGWQRGNTAMAGVTLSANLAGLTQLKDDPAPVSLDAAPSTTAKDWTSAIQALRHNAGLNVRRISQRGDELLVEAEPTKYRSLQESENRANRILHNATATDIDNFRYRWQSAGMGLRDDVHSRQAFLAASSSAAHDQHYRHSLYATALTEPDNAPIRGKLLYEDSLSNFSWGISPGLNQNLGGPDGYLYQIYAKLDAEYRTDPNGWFSGRLAWNLYDNLDEYQYIAESRLPRVRTYIGDYLAETDLGIYNLQYTRTKRLGGNWYAMGYGGLLEMMYAGAGGELLYRPFNSPVAYGFDLNWVKQRDFDQQFSMRDYSTWTGHITAYIETGIEDVLAKISIGRYLAKDIGTTIDLSREFDSGVRVGAWATFTDAGDDYGEGSFDKGIYVSLPFDAFFTTSSRSQTTLAWRPLTRDGGARLNRRFSLYGMTQERSMGRYWEETAQSLK